MRLWLTVLLPSRLRRCCSLWSLWCSQRHLMIQLRRNHSLPPPLPTSASGALRPMVTIMFDNLMRLIWYYVLMIEPSQLNSSIVYVWGIHNIICLKCVVILSRQAKLNMLRQPRKKKWSQKAKGGKQMTVRVFCLYFRIRIKGKST